MQTQKELIGAKLIQAGKAVTALFVVMVLFGGLACVIAIAKAPVQTTLETTP